MERGVKREGGEARAAAVKYEWRGAFRDDEVNALHAEAFEHPAADIDWVDQLARFSVGWVLARDEAELVGFVNVAWDGRAHAFVVDAAVALRARRLGIGERLVSSARDGAAEAGCAWLHVDFEERPRSFSLDACGFSPTDAGLIRLG